MELLLKFENKLKKNEYPLQRKYGDTNIGFDKLCEFEKYDIKAKKNPYDLTTLQDLVKSETVMRIDPNYKYDCLTYSLIE